MSAGQRKEQKLIPVERRQIILEMVAEKGIVSIAELTDRMNVSHMTIRRAVSYTHLDVYKRQRYS